MVTPMPPLTDSGVTPYSTAAPTTEPRHWASRFLVTTMAAVTAGFRWAPLTCPKHCTNVAMLRPKHSEMSTRLGAGGCSAPAAGQLMVEPRLSRTKISIAVNSAATERQNSCVHTPLKAVMSLLGEHQVANLARLWVERLQHTHSDQHVLQGKKSRLRAEAPATTQITRVKAMSSTTVLLEWAHVSTADSYFVVAIPEEGQNHTVTVTNTSMVLTGLTPRMIYRCSVFTENSGGQGWQSMVKAVLTPLSPVSDVSVDYRCDSNAAVVSWAPVFGADSYRATATGNGTVKYCTGLGIKCQIEGMACSQSYMVSVIAMAGNCKSPGPSNITTFQTGLYLFRECSTNAIIFSWAPINHTDYYLATLGETQHCMTSDVHCFFTKTTCGQGYNFTVYSVTGACSSQSSQPATIKTAPCVPQNFRTTSDCSADTLTLSWEPSAGALFYDVEVIGNQGPDDDYNCSTSDDSCTIHGFHCGQHLSTSLVAYNNECSSRMLMGRAAETVPCTPQNVSAIMDCGADSVTVRWNMASGAIFYSAWVLDGSGHVHSCQTGGTVCQVRGLQCSTMYTGYVIASNFNCNSSESAWVTMETASCPPDHVRATLDCVANEALVSWGGEAHMQSYTAMAEDPEGHALNCSTAEHSCAIERLRCGQRYRVSVLYHDGVCPSMPSAPVFMESVPCGPESMSTSVNCSSGQLAVDWNASPGAGGYTVVLTRGDGGPGQSCTTSDTGCSFDTSECGHEFSVEVKSFRGACQSFASEDTIREVPCAPRRLAVERDCSDNSATVTWEASRGAESYTVTGAVVAGGGPPVSCSPGAGTTTCRLEGLACGAVYDVTVVAVAAGCSSDPGDFVVLPAVPCQPSQLTVSVDCSTNDATLSWDGSASASRYSAQAVGTDGQRLGCDVTAPTCVLEGLHCGQGYVFTVSASDGSCFSPSSLPVEDATAPCAPTDVLVATVCSREAITVSWTRDSVPLNYNVSASSPASGMASCATGGAGCTVEGLQCGTEYSVSVRATDGHCEGPSSALQFVHCAPCTPGNVQRVLNCSSNTVDASWDPAAGAFYYAASLTDAQNVTTPFNTTDPAFTFADLRCAQRYTFAVAALDRTCSSALSLGAPVTTAPCDPENVVASLDCQSGVATVTWTAGLGDIVYYTVLAQAPGQPTISIQVYTTSCILDQLQCGEVYDVYVLAGDGNCNSSLYASTTINTAPCTPQILSHVLNCTTNQALVTWAPDAHAVSFSVIAMPTAIGELAASCFTTGDSCVLNTPCTPANVDPTYTCASSIALLSWDETRGRLFFYASVRAGQHMDSCTTDETHCAVHSLLCGRLYDVSVDAVALHCNSSQPGRSQIQTAPCAPQNVTASLVCSDNTAQVSWLASGGAVRYEVVALGRDGDRKQCNTTGTTCSLPNMHCAETYKITVTPYSDTCVGATSTSLIYIAVSLQCVGNVGTVSWLPAVLADSYQAWATAVDGHNHTCMAAGNVTNCSFTDLHCGESYAVTVVTTDRGCQSEFSAPVTLKSVLCPPANLAGVTFCPLNNIEVTWDASPESDVAYHLHVWSVTPGNMTISIPDTDYQLTGLQCGTTISLAIEAEDAVCLSALSQTIYVPTVPCAPTDLTAVTQCGTELGHLSWSAGSGATGYVATATAANGHVSSCSSNGTSCSVLLDCGQHYTAEVVSSTSTCNSSGVATTHFDSAPCLPENVVAVLDCESDVFVVQWDAGTGGTVSYTAVAIAGDGSRADCVTLGSSCTISGLHCGLTYSIAVIPSTANCGSINSTDYKIESAPCTPQGAAVVLECSTNVATVSWSGTGPDQYQVVTAVGSRGNTAACNSTTTHCSLTS
ncbi:hypothetical protein CRUP_037689 [Coryphaenoides rupestris]|nr:hypothetical protein CRUP_037689 [Coryphaenoides rupestris]